MRRMRQVVDGKQTPGFCSPLNSSVRLIRVATASEDESRRAGVAPPGLVHADWIPLAYPWSRRCRALIHGGVDADLTHIKPRNANQGAA
jgi:hypothetical protein